MNGKKVVSPVLDQRQEQKEGEPLLTFEKVCKCGWAFASSTALESAIAIVTNTDFEEISI